LSTQDPASAAGQSVTSMISASCAYFLQPRFECVTAGDRIRARREGFVGGDLCRVDR